MRSGAKLKGPTEGVEDDDPAEKFRVGLITGVAPVLPKLLLLEEETALLAEGDDIAVDRFQRRATKFGSDTIKRNKIVGYWIVPLSRLRPSIYIDR